MQKNPRYRPAALALTVAEVLILVSVFGCGDSGGGNVQPPTPVAKVSVSAPMTGINVGQTVQLTATAEDANGNNVDGASFEWSSSDAGIASVSATGLVTGIASGQVEVSATSEGVKGDLAITVAAVSPPPGPVNLGLQEIARLSFPDYLTSPPGDERLFVLEKRGTIRIIKGGVVLPTPFLDISSQVSTKTEQGLLGLAFPPNYGTSGTFFVYYSDLKGDTRVSSFRVTGDPDRADPASETLVLGVGHPGVSHYGGQLLFGPDGFLYIGLGDGGSRDGMDQGRGQSLDDLLGAILRIDVSSGTSYSVPPDNPFVGTPGARPEIWNYGFRNPWRFSFDRGTGDLYIGDVGESQWEEVDYSSAADGAGRGKNYGWSLMEGTDCFGNGQCDRSGLSLPLLEYSHADGCAITGGYVYRGNAIPALQGHYFYSDFCSGWVRSFKVEGNAPTEQTDWPTLAVGRYVTSMGEDAAGELYLMMQQGRVLKIVPK